MKFLKKRKFAPVPEHLLSQGLQGPKANSIHLIAAFSSLTWDDRSTQGTEVATTSLFCWKTGNRHDQPWLGLVQQQSELGGQLERERQLNLQSS